MGHGRAAGFYRQMERRADPEAAQQQQEEAGREERRRQRREAKAQAEQEERQREREEHKREHREENGWGKDKQPHSHHQERQQPNGQQGRPATRRWREEHEEQRSKSWAEYDARFRLFWDGCTRNGTVNVWDVPLPPAGHAPIMPSANQEDWHQSIRKAELRWHPDKWAKVLRMLDGDEEQQMKLKSLCEKMFRAVMLCKDRGFRKQAAMVGV